MRPGFIPSARPVLHFEGKIVTLPVSLSKTSTVLGLVLILFK